MCVNNFNFGIVSSGFPFYLGSCKDATCVNRVCPGSSFVQRVVSFPCKEIEQTMMTNPGTGIEEERPASGSGFEENMESNLGTGNEERIPSSPTTGVKQRAVPNSGKGIRRRIVSNAGKEIVYRIVSEGIEQKVAYLMRKGIGEPSGICDIFLIAISFLVVICTFPLSLFFCFKVVQEYERAVIFRLGRLSKGGARGPGLFFILPCTDNYCKVDLRTVSFNVPPQEVLSKDSVTVAVDAVVYYRISNATIAVSNVADYATSTQLLAATTLRTVLGTKSLSEILSEREHISHVMQSNLEATRPWGVNVERVEIKDVRLPKQMQRAMAAEAEASREARAKSSLDEATTPWGVKVERVEIKDVRLPQQMQRAMAAEAEASREARAKVIAAEGEQKASRALKEAADVIADSPGALQLRYLQTLTSIAAEKNSTVVFPLPMELMRGMGLK